jgi:uncharacterized protein (TIGR00251 family)
LTRSSSPPSLPDLRETDGGVILKVRVQPRASADALGGIREGALVVRLTAPPVEGKANAALARFLGRALRVPPSSIEVVRGATGRDKLVRIAGLTPSAMRTLLEVV